MTRHPSDSEAGLSLASARQLLRSAGLRSTSARIAVLQHLWQEVRPLSPVDLAARLVDYGFDRSTIYRSLSDLEACGLIRRLELGTKGRHFEPAGAGADSHPHFVCMDCGYVQCLQQTTVSLTTSPGERQLAGQISDVLVQGHCPDCLVQDG